jgi:hypothetical protein
MRRATSDQGTLFGPAAPSRTARGRQPPKQTTVTVSAEAIAAATAGRMDGERVIAAAIRAARPDVRNVAVDLGSIRWTDPKSRRRVTFTTPAVVREALLEGGARLHRREDMHEARTVAALFQHPGDDRLLADMAPGDMLDRDPRLRRHGHCPLANAVTQR